MLKYGNSKITSLSLLAGGVVASAFLFQNCSPANLETLKEDAVVRESLSSQGQEFYADAESTQNQLTGDSEASGESCISSQVDYLKSTECWLTEYQKKFPQRSHLLAAVAQRSKTPDSEYQKVCGNAELRSIGVLLPFHHMRVVDSDLPVVLYGVPAEDYSVESEDVNDANFLKYNRINGGPRSLSEMTFEGPHIPDFMDGKVLRHNAYVNKASYGEMGSFIEEFEFKNYTYGKKTTMIEGIEDYFWMSLGYNKFSDSIFMSDYRNREGVQVALMRRLGQNSKTDLWTELGGRSRKGLFYKYKDEIYSGNHAKMPTFEQKIFLDSGKDGVGLGREDEVSCTDWTTAGAKLAPIEASVLKSFEVGPDRTYSCDDAPTLMYSKTRKMYYLAYYCSPRVADYFRGEINYVRLSQFFTDAKYKFPLQHRVKWIK